MTEQTAHRSGSAFARRFLVIWVPLCLVSALLAVLFYRAESHAILTVTRQGARQAVRLGVQSVYSDIAGVESDLLFLANVPALDQWLGDTETASRHRLETTYEGFMRTKLSYDQIRLLNLSGQEILRLNWNQGEPVAVSKGDLQDKSNRYYVKPATNLRRNGIYISPFDLNVEHGALEQPYKPVIRFATPVYDSGGVKRALLIVNFLGSRLLGALDSLGRGRQRDLWLLNSDGYWMTGLKPGDRWGFMFPSRHSSTMAQRFPYAWRAMKSSKDGVAQTRDGGLVAFQSMLLAGTGTDKDTTRRWILAAYLPPAAITAATATLAHRTEWAYAGLVVLFAAAAWFAAALGIRRAEAESRLRASESRMRTLLEAAPDAVITCDARGRIEFLNPQAECMFGYSRRELVGQPIEVLVPERYHHHHEDLRNGYIANPKVRELGSGQELWGRRKDGSEIPVAISLGPVLNERGQMESVFADIRDVTQRRRADNEIHALNTRLAVQNQELQSVNHELEAFSYSVSHDLRAPLRAVDGFSRILQNELHHKLDAAAQDKLARVRRAAQHMGELIDDLLKLSRVSRADIKREPVDLSAMAREIVEELHNRDPERSVRADIAEGLSTKADSRLIRVALENLLSNAWKFTSEREEGRIEFGSTADAAPNSDSSSATTVPASTWPMPISCSGPSSGCTMQWSSRERASDWPRYSGLSINMAAGSGPMVQWIAAQPSISSYHKESGNERKGHPAGRRQPGRRIAHPQRVRVQRHP